MSTAHILVVEDEENLAQTLSLNLQLEQYKVSLAHNGSEAMKQLAAGITGFDLIILDVMLPDMNGYDLCKEIRSRAPALPVIFLTAKNQKPDKLEGLKLGADDYITKPFDLDELLLRVSNLIRRSKTPSADSFSFGPCKIDFTSYDIITATGQ